MEDTSHVTALVLTSLSISDICHSEMVRWSGASGTAAYCLFSVFVGLMRGTSLTQF